MKEKSVVNAKSYAFAIRIVKLYKYLNCKDRYNPLARQILRSGTSICANIEEANGAVSMKDFLSKISVSYKEGRETRYWLRLLKDTDYIEEKGYESLLGDCEELLRIISKIQITTKSRIYDLKRKKTCNS